MKLWSAAGMPDRASEAVKLSDSTEEALLQVLLDCGALTDGSVRSIRALNDAPLLLPAASVTVRVTVVGTTAPSTFVDSAVAVSLKLWSAAGMPDRASEAVKSSDSTELALLQVMLDCASLTVGFVLSIRAERVRVVVLPAASLMVLLSFVEAVALADSSDAVSVNPPVALSPWLGASPEPPSLAVKFSARAVLRQVVSLTSSGFTVGAVLSTLTSKAFGVACTLSALSIAMYLMVVTVSVENESAVVYRVDVAVGALPSVV